MAELERDLTLLGSAIEFPPTPLLAQRVQARIAAEPRERPRWEGRRLALVALAAVLVAIAIAFAVPPARSALLRWFGLSGVRIRRVDELPQTPVRGKLFLGRHLSLADARHTVAYRLRVPAKASHPRAVYLRSYPPGGAVSFLYGSPRRPRLLMMQFEANASPFIEKVVATGTRVERVRVNGHRGYWLSGGRHFFIYIGRDGQTDEESLRLAGNTLLWEDGPLTLRLEGKLTKDEALAIARSVR